LKMNRLGLGFLLFAFVVAQQAAWGWGSDGHMYVNRVAAEKLPQDVPACLRNAVAELTYLGPEPDRWRDDPDPALKSAQEPDHYIDLERIAWLDHGRKVGTSSTRSSMRNGRRPRTTQTITSQNESASNPTS
jgi:hypothetical protein